MRRWLFGLALCAGCGARLGDAPSQITGDGGRGDAALIADAAIDAPLGPWSAPVPITPAATLGVAEDDDTVSASGLELVYVIAGAGGRDLYVVTRADVTAPWTGAPTKLPFNSPNSDDTPRFSADDLTLYFESNRAGGPGLGDIWMVTRASVGAPWGTPTLVPGNVNSAANERWFAPCTGGRYVEIHNDGVAPATDLDLVEGTLGGGPPTPITELNSTSNETGTMLSDDCLTIYFASTRAGNLDLYTSHRPAIGMPWSTPTPLADFDTTLHNEQDPFMSANGRLFVFASDKSGDNDLYMSTR